MKNNTTESKTVEVWLPKHLENEPLEVFEIESDLPHLDLRAGEMVFVNRNAEPKAGCLVITETEGERKVARFLTEPQLVCSNGKKVNRKPRKSKSIYGVIIAAYRKLY